MLTLELRVNYITQVNRLCKQVTCAQHGHMVCAHAYCKHACVRESTFTVKSFGLL